MVNMKRMGVGVLAAGAFFLSSSEVWAGLPTMDPGNIANSAGIVKNGAENIKAVGDVTGEAGKLNSIIGDAAGSFSKLKDQVSGVTDELAKVKEEATKRYEEAEKFVADSKETIQQAKDTYSMAMDIVSDSQNGESEEESASGTAQAMNSGQVSATMVAGGTMQAMDVNQISAAGLATNEQMVGRQAFGVAATSGAAAMTAGSAMQAAGMSAQKAVATPGAAAMTAGGAMQAAGMSAQKAVATPGAAAMTAGGAMQAAGMSAQKAVATTASGQTIGRQAFGKATAAPTAAKATAAPAAAKATAAPAAAKATAASAAAKATAAPVAAKATAAPVAAKATAAPTAAKATAAPVAAKATAAPATAKATAAPAAAKATAAPVKRQQFRMSSGASGVQKFSRVIYKDSETLAFASSTGESAVGSSYVGNVYIVPMALYCQIKPEDFINDEKVRTECVEQIVRDNNADNSFDAALSQKECQKMVYNTVIALMAEATNAKYEAANYSDTLDEQDDLSSDATTTRDDMSVIAMSNYQTQLLLNRISMNFSSQIILDTVAQLCAAKKDVLGDSDMDEDGSGDGE